MNICTLCHCDLNDEQSEFLGDLLRLCSPLDEIDLSGNKNMRQGLKSIYNGLKSAFHFLNVLKLHSCNLNETQSEFLEDLLK